MKIQFVKKIFLKHLDNISKALDSNPYLNSLQGILIFANETFIKIIASNGNLSIKEIVKVDLDIKVINPGKILLPGKLFKEIIKKQEDKIMLELINENVLISSQNTKVHLNILNLNDYPKINFDVIGKELIVDAIKLKEVIKNVSFAASENDKRIILNGVNLKAFNGFLQVTATNSFRLAHEKMQINSDIDFDITILSKNLKDFLPPEVSGEIKISVDDSKIITQFKNTTIISKLIDGVYPDFEKLIPKEFNNTLTIEKRELENLINKVITMTNENTKVTRININKNQLLIESKKDEVGNIKVNSSNFKWNGDDFSIVFNATFLKEAISKFDGKIELKINGNQKPIVIFGLSNPLLIHLVLPHRTY